jgi:energy-coupling factor transporter ATP-binding protein EcfA2
MANKNMFDILLLIARPGAGKSEIIDYLKGISREDRKGRFHVGEMDEIDDFPMLWAWFEEDTLLEQMGHPRFHTDDQGYFLWQHLWDLLIKRMCLEYQKSLRDIPGYSDNYTTIVEFSRGREHGGYRSAFLHLDPQMLRRMAVLYVDVSWEESLRKNRKRYNPEKPDSILEHALPDSKLERLYKEIDWEEISSADPEFLSIQSIRVPYVVFDNSDDVTTHRGPELGVRLEQVMEKLWESYLSNHAHL